AGPGQAAEAHDAAAAEAPADLRDVNAWIAWKNSQQLSALPVEARLFYRRGLMARQSGQFPEALADVRGAIELDPAFMAPHAMLAFLWPHLKLRERVLFVMLAIAAAYAPFALSTLDRFTLALHTDSLPIYEITAIEPAAWNPQSEARLEGYARNDPRNGFAQFALAWLARRGGQLDVAERAYSAALEAWPEHSAVLTDLGNVLAMRGKADQ